VIGFLHPWVLAGLPLAAVPLILHLLQRREPPTIEFPAVRYLVQVTEQFQRRLRLQHWLLLLIRTLLVLALVVAAAGPSVPLRASSAHAPSALVLVLDNSPSSGVVVSGTPILTDLRAAARRILQQASSSDALWLLESDGIARRGGPAELESAVDSTAPSFRRLDLGEALGIAQGVLATDRRPGAIAVLTDLQASALSPAPTKVPVTVIRPDGPAPENVGIVRLDPGPQPWTPEGGSVTVGLAGDSAAPVPVSVSLGDGPGRQALVSVGGAAAFALNGASIGWWTVQAAKTADELRADDHMESLVRVAPVAKASWDTTNRYLNVAAQVLLQSRRLERGTDLSLGSLGSGASVVMPPADAADLGALNRALARRGAGWSYGALSTVPVLSDSGALFGRISILKRYALVPGRVSAETGVVATAGGQPWIVRSGNVVLLASRLDPTWTALPLSAGFMPFVDALVNRLARGQLALLAGAPGDAILIPDLTTEVVHGDHRWRVEGGAAFRPPTTGVYFLVSGRDTLGGISVNLDPRETDLRRASDRAVGELWPTARVVSLGEAADAAFAGARRASLQGALLWLALLLGLVEVGLASGLPRLP